MNFINMDSEEMKDMPEFEKPELDYQFSDIMEEVKKQ